jgi:hypothetical protein
MLFCKYSFRPRYLLLMVSSGCLLADDTSIAIAVGVVSFLLACGLEWMAWRAHHRRRTVSKVDGLMAESSSSDVQLQQVRQE